MFGSFLTWLQEKTAPVFVVATANRIEHLPPELLRKGRFDEIFFVDLPAEEERREIFEHPPPQAEARPGASSTWRRWRPRRDGFSGAEIEQAIVAALYDAFDAGRDITTEDLLRNVRALRPALPAR